MICLFSGTPGSGKSLHCARLIYYSLARGLPVICNFPINLTHVRHPENFKFIDNSKLCPSDLIEFSRSYFDGKRVREGRIKLIIDEAQMLFNARTWGSSGRNDWNKFFCLHRHFGYDILFVAQFDRMLDRQIRYLIEYEFIHRKVSNMGWRGFLLSFFMLSPKLFVSVKVWYPMKERVSSEFFKAHKKYYRLYDTFALLEAD